MKATQAKQATQATKTLKDILEQCKLDPPVEVRTSKRHGKGVFATRDISKGTPVAFYDGELFENEKTINIDQHQYSLEYPESWLPISTGIKSMTCIGFKEPRTAYGCGQLINDSIRPDLDSLVDKTTGKLRWKDCIQAMNEYTRISHQLSSVHIDPRKECERWLFARRDIREGEELVNHYGEVYWLLQLASDSQQLSVLISLFACHEQEYLNTIDPTEEQSKKVMSKYNRLWESVSESSKNAEWTLKEMIIMIMREYLIFD